MLYQVFIFLLPYVDLLILKFIIMAITPEMVIFCQCVHHFSLYVKFSHLKFVDISVLQKLSCTVLA